MSTTEIQDIIQEQTKIQASLVKIIEVLHQQPNPNPNKGVHGIHFEKYDENLDDYLDRLTAYLDLQGIHETKKVNV